MSRGTSSLISLLMGHGTVDPSRVDGVLERVNPVGELLDIAVQADAKVSKP